MEYITNVAIGAGCVCRSCRQWNNCSSCYITDVIIKLASFAEQIKNTTAQSERREVVVAQQNIIKGLMTLEKRSEGYRQHNEFEAISTLFIHTYDRFMDCYLKNEPINTKRGVK